MLCYDNLEDCKSKLAGTLAYYKGKVVVIKDAKHHPEDRDRFQVAIQSYNSKAHSWINLDDPDFNYQRFNLGYANSRYGFATWWARVPLRQYQQGLKANQLIAHCSKPDWRDNSAFSFEPNVIDMLENRYKSFEACRGIVSDPESGVKAMAFHKHWACSYDKMFKGFLLEYKGKNVGTWTTDKGADLHEEHKHLTEYLKEVIG